MVILVLLCSLLLSIDGCACGCWWGSPLDCVLFPGCFGIQVRRPTFSSTLLLRFCLALLPLGGGWVLAQVHGGGQPLGPNDNATPPPESVLSPLEPPSMPPPSDLMPRRVDPKELGPAQPARRYEDYVKDLMDPKDLLDQGVITRSEYEGARRRRVDVLDPRAFLEACKNQAASSAECSGKASIRLGLRDHVPSDASGVTNGARLGADGMPLPPLTVPVSALLAGDGGSFNLASVFRVTPRPAPILGNGNRRLLLPIIGTASPSSGFGWRLHPLLGIWRMHAGEDLAAPEGTPVVAALSGRVVSSGLAGGYGLAVEIEHQRPLRRTLYGHLSELYVKAGEWVSQGEVVGRVGSTGLSTGPHLHFELRQPGDGGWVAVDPGELDPGSGLKGQDAIAVLMGQLLAALERPRG